MKRHLSEAAVAHIMSQLIERFGEPIGDGQGVPSSKKKMDMGNRGFGAKFEVSQCNECSGMMGMDDECTSCGKMPTELGAVATPKALPPAGGAEEEEVVVVVGGRENPRGSRPGSTNGNVAAGVHPPQGMDVPPEALPKKGKPAGPAAPPSVPVTEGMYAVTPEEVLTTWEDLYLDTLRQRRKTDQAYGPRGAVSLESLASWLGVPEEAVRGTLSRAGLVLDKNGNVVSRGNTPN